MALVAKTGWLAATSHQLRPGHAEKILLVRREFAERRPAEHVALIAAILEACRFCQLPENAEQIAEILARPENVNARVSSFQAQGWEAPRPIFYGHGVNEPSMEKAEWMLEGMKACGLSAEQAAVMARVGPGTFRSDIFQQALDLPQFSNHEKTPELDQLAATV
jgi:ABC-type nitrate/sulfonate/bicarbonate transport system substrate-binding protein